MKKLGEKLDVKEYKNKSIEFSQSKSNVNMREMYIINMDLFRIFQKIKHAKNIRVLLLNQSIIVLSKKDWHLCLLASGYI